MNERITEALRQARDFIDEEREHDPDNAHQNDRDNFRERNALRPKLIAELDAALQHQSYLPVEAEGWQPIETAPKDGKRVDLWVRPWDAFANGNPGRITDAWFEDGEWKRVLAGWPHNVSSCGEATHWMPLATAPSTGGR